MIQNKRLWWKIIVAMLLCITPFIAPPSPAVASTQVQQVDQNNNTISSNPVLIAGQALTLYVKVSNISSATLTSVSISTTGSCSNVTVNIQTGAQDINAGSFKQYLIEVSAPSGTSSGTCNSIRVVPSVGSGSATMRFTISGVGPTATPTPQPAGICDLSDPPSDIAGAWRIASNTSVEQGICFTGDIDTYALPMNRDKVYEIYISQSFMVTEDNPKLQSLDLVLELYDPLFRLVTVNDDFYAHNSNDSMALVVDPKIANYRAPMDGNYYVRVRDATGANIGHYTLKFNNLSYRGDANNNVDETVPNNSGVCQDLYEPDGLPEQARVILSNQRQKERRLCPTGDADWAKFFAKSGNTYVLYTSTTSDAAGVDTYITLFDRDGFTVLDSNDNYQASSLNAKVVFTASADGFYFVQIKNTGDLGGPFLTYELVNEVCNELNRATCVADTATATPTATLVPTTTPDANQDPDDATFDYGDTDTRNDNLETDAGFFTASVRPTKDLINGPFSGFVDSAFESLWNRTDRPIVRQQVNRGWIWGPAGLMAHAESFLQISGGQRQVQYFDKGRMEINNPNGDRQSTWFVTSGLLVTELVSGRMQVGSNDYIAREPSNVVVAGDITNAFSPTYASLTPLLGLRTIDRTGQVVDQQLLRDGSVIPFNGTGASMTQLVYYVNETGHNIPQVFFDYLNRQDTIYVDGRTQYGLVMDWVHTMGYPLTEAYWTRTTIGGVEQWVLVQPFERRLLTYVPNNQAGWQVEQGNVGRHYYRWRYGIDP